MPAPSDCIRDWCLAPAAWDSGCISHHSIKHIPLTTPAALQRLKPHWYLSAYGHREKLGLQSLLKNKALSHEPWAWQPRTVDSVLFTQNTHSRGGLAQEEAVTSWQMPPRAAAHWWLVYHQHTVPSVLFTFLVTISERLESLELFFFLLKLISNFSLSRQIYRHSLIFEIKIFIQTIFITFKYFTASTWWKIWLFFTIQTPKAMPSLSSIVAHFKNGELKTYIEIFHFPLHNTQ